MIIKKMARMAEPRLPANQYMENQLTGDLPRAYPVSQVYAGGFAVSAVEEKPGASPPRPVPARGPHGAHDSLVVELIEEPESQWRKNLSVLAGSEAEFFHDDPETQPRPDRRLLFPKKKPAIGENNGASKLTAASVIQMRAEARRGVSQRRLARKYRVSRATVFDVISGKTWQHVPDTREGEPDDE